MAGVAKAILLTLALATVGCGEGTFDGSCDLRPRVGVCDEIYNAGAARVATVEMQCGTAWSTSKMCDRGGTVGSCHFPDGSDGHVVEWYGSSSYTYTTASVINASSDPSALILAISRPPARP